MDYSERPKILHVSAKCSDMCDLTLTSEDGSILGEKGDYVPSGLGIGSGDYVSFSVDLDTGQIVGWTRPADEALLALMPVNPDA